MIINSMDQDFSAMPGTSQGNLCLGGAIGRHNANIVLVGSAGTASIRWT